MDNKNFSITRVVTKDVITDSFQTLRNFFGLRLRGYERVINKNTNEMIEEMVLAQGDVVWWRMSVNPLTDGSIMITVYGART